jgi:hypothetical protein
METDPIPIKDADPAVPFNRLFGKVPAEAGEKGEAHSRALPQTTLFVFRTPWEDRSGSRRI